MAEKILTGIIMIALTYIYCKPEPVIRTAPTATLSTKNVQNDAQKPSTIFVRKQVRQSAPVTRLTVKNTDIFRKSQGKPQILTPTVSQGRAPASVPIEAEYRSERDHEADAPFVEEGWTVEDLQRSGALHR